MNELSFDVVVIGGGPGGYVFAIRAAQLGMKVALAEKDRLGGTCLNVGCIPTKALLQSSHLFGEAGNRFAEHGVFIEGLSFDLKRMMERKDKIVSDNVKGVEFLLKKNRIGYFEGTARILSPTEVAVFSSRGENRLSAKSIVIATGSAPLSLSGVEIDERRILSSTGALALERPPEHLAIIGAGAIGLELGSVWSRLGSKVTVIEYTDRILPSGDNEIGKHAQRFLTRQGMIFKLSTKVLRADASGEKAVLSLESHGEKQMLEADAVLVAAGRRPQTADLGLDSAGVGLDQKGFVKVGPGYATNVPGIYAIGDVIGGAMLAHKAEEEAVALAEILAGQAGSVNYDAIPAVVYCRPEIASVGKTEEQLRGGGIAYRIGKFPFTANGRARTLGETDGFVKILADQATDRVLGAHIIGPSAGDLIAEIVLGMEFAAAAEDIARTCHAHPSLGEAVKEAALAAWSKPLHA
ncbi:dihydrolipoyl dehydrogenase [Alphaproteobacteria bacterium]|nr:dihydrolipoyl dehydrogenase [Alphaproteobacteria bacterium]